MAYLLDANVFIAARNLHYGFDFCPGFWDWLDRAHQAGRVFSIERVADELIDEELAEWARGRGNGFFLAADAATVPAFNTLSDWVNTQPQYATAAKNTFLQVADYYLVAQALAASHTLVTHEQPANSRAQIKIPNACLGVGVRYINTFEMLRRERARFVLPHAPGGTLWDAKPEDGNDD